MPRSHSIGSSISMEPEIFDGAPPRDVVATSDYTRWRTVVERLKPRGSRILFEGTLKGRKQFWNAIGGESKDTWKMGMELRRLQL